jgi:RNA polymerase sigma-70 factor (ECF subfamily)
MKTYLYRVVINAAIDAKKRVSRWNAIRELLGRIHRPPLHNSYEIKDLTRKLFAGIPPEFKIPLALAEVNGMSYREIAEILNVSVETVRIRIFRCRHLLKKEYEAVKETVSQLRNVVYKTLTGKYGNGQ